MFRSRYGCCDAVHARWWRGDRQSRSDTDVKRLQLSVGMIWGNVNVLRMPGGA